MDVALLPTSTLKETDLARLEEPADILALCMLGTIGAGKFSVPGLKPSSGSDLEDASSAAPLGGMPARYFSMSSLERLPMLVDDTGGGCEFERCKDVEDDGRVPTCSTLVLALDLDFRLGSSLVAVGFFLAFLTSTGGGCFFLFVFPFDLDLEES